MPPPLMSQRALPPNARGPTGQGPRGSLLGPPPGQFMRGPFDQRNMMNNMRPPFGGPQGNPPLLPNLQVCFIPVAHLWWVLILVFQLCFTIPHTCT